MYIAFGILKQAAFVTSPVSEAPSSYATATSASSSVSGLRSKLHAAAMSDKRDRYPHTHKRRRSFDLSHKYSDRKGKVVKLYRQAQQAAQEGKLDGAEAMFRRCLMMDRKDARSWLQLAQLASRRGRQEEAQSYFAQAVSECPESVHLLQSWAMLEGKLGRLDKACSLFEKGMSLEPGNPYIAHAWGQLERRRGRTSKARKLYTDSLRLHGPWAQVYMALAELEVESGQVEKAKQIFREALESCASERHKILVAWAKLEEGNSGNWDKASELLAQAVEEGGPDFNQAIVNLAHLEMRKGHQKRAVDILKQSKSQANCGSLFNTWAAVEAKAGNVDTAIKLLEDAVQMFPNDCSLLQTLGTLEVRRGQYDKARDCFFRSTAIRPHVVTYNAWAIMEERRARKLKGPMRDVQVMRARKLFMSGIEEDASHGPLYNAYGRMEERFGNATGAHAVFKLGVEARCPDMPSVLNGWAMLAMKQGDHELARKLLRQGLSESKLGKNVGFLYHSLGMLELRLGHHMEAWTTFMEAIGKYPRHSQLLVGAGLTAEKRRDIEVARSLFRRGVESNRLHHQAWQAWAVMEHRQGNVHTARELFRLGVKANSGFGALWQAYGVLEFQEQNLETARDLFAEGVQRDPHHVMLYQAWAVLEVKVQRYQRAKELLQEGLRIDPSHGACWSVLGYIEGKCGKIDEARRIFEHGITQDPSHAPLYRVFGDFERRQDNIGRARVLYERAIDLDPHYAETYMCLRLMEVGEGNATGADLIAEASRRVFSAEYDLDGVSSDTYDTAVLGDLE